MSPAPAPHLDDFSLPPFGDLFEENAGRSPFSDLEAHFWARDQQRDLLHVAQGWWAMAWFCAQYDEGLAIRLGDRARVFEARAERYSYSEWVISASTSFFLTTGVVALLGALLLKSARA